MLKRFYGISLFKNSAIYATTNVVNAAIPFALLPILTRYLGPAEYGQLAMFQTFLGLLSAFVGFSVAGAAARKYYDKNITNLELSYFIASCVQILFGSAVLVFLIVLLFSHQLTALLGLRTSWLLYAVLFSTMSIVIQLRLSQWQIREFPNKFAMFQISQSSINVLLSLFLAITLKLRSEGRILAQVSSYTIFGILALYLLKREGLLNLFVWRPLYIREALKFGVPLVPHMCSAFLMGSVDRVVINKELGIATAGIYMVAIQLTSVADLFFDAVNKAYVPWLYKKLALDTITDKMRIVRGTYLWFVFIVLCGMIAAAFGPMLVLLIAGRKYEAAGSLLGWLVFGQIFNGMYYMVTNYIFFSKKTSVLSLITFSSGLINFSLLLLLVKRYGMKGAAIAFCLSAFVQFTVTWFAAHKLHPMPWSSWRMLKDFSFQHGETDELP